MPKRKKTQQMVEPSQSAPVIEKQPDAKTITMGKCLAAGFDCEIRNSVLMFYTVDPQEIDRAKDLLGIRQKKSPDGGMMDDVASLPPFSFGFTTRKNAGGAMTREKVEVVETEEDQEEI